MLTSCILALALARYLLEASYCDGTEEHGASVLQRLIDFRPPSMAFDVAILR